MRFHIGTSIEALHAARGHVTRIVTDQGSHAMEGCVLTLGAQSPFLAKPLGLRLPIYPLKGYSLTLPASAQAPRISITDFKRKVVYAPVVHNGVHHLRVAGMADIAGHSRQIDPARLGNSSRNRGWHFPPPPTTRGIQRGGNRGPGCGPPRPRARRYWARRLTRIFF